MNELFRVAHLRGRISVNYQDDKIELHAHKDGARWFWIVRDKERPMNFESGLDATLDEAVLAACKAAGLTPPAAEVAA